MLKKTKCDSQNYLRLILIFSSVQQFVFIKFQQILDLTQNLLFRKIQPQTTPNHLSIKWLPNNPQNTKILLLGYGSWSRNSHTNPNFLFYFFISKSYPSIKPLKALYSPIFSSLLPPKSQPQFILNPKTSCCPEVSTSDLVSQLFILHQLDYQPVQIKIWTKTILSFIVIMFKVSIQHI